MPMHKSVALTEQPCEFIDIEPVNPLISKCHIKVCYVQDTANRNRSIITKDVAKDMAKSLPGSPIVGYFNKGNKDFEEHNRSITVSNNTFEIEDTTRPYGFVDLNAKCWFQKFQDDDEVIREYLMTEGYIWTGQYPEAQRVIDKGNNQSMELDEKFLDASWTTDDNGKPQFFIINEAVISKLCILGEDFEPCFEGSNITAAPQPVEFSLDENFQKELLSMMKGLKEYLMSKGGSQQVYTTYAVEIGNTLWDTLYSYIVENYPNMEDRWCSIYRLEGVFEENADKFAILQDRKSLQYYKMAFMLTEAGGLAVKGGLEEVTKTFVPSTTPQFNAEEVDKYIAEYKQKKEEEEEEKKKNDKSAAPAENPEDPDKKDKGDESDGKKDPDKKSKKAPAAYTLEEIPEYVELSTKFSELETNYSTLLEENETLKASLNSLTEFKNGVEKEKKQAMIDSFCMLSDEDKKDVVENIDKYSVDEIEAKLSVICVRNKVSFNLEEELSNDKAPTTFNLNSGDYIEDSSTPAWVKAAMDVAKTLN